MNDRREELRRDYPERTSMEHTKMIGEEWQALSPERRAPYMKAAELDKIRYYKRTFDSLFTFSKLF